MVEDSIVKGPQPGALINTTVGASFDETVKQLAVMPHWWSGTRGYAGLMTS